MAAHISDDALRSQVRMQLAFWRAKDRRSITTGPSWLWRGPLTGPRRADDLPSPTARKIAARHRQGMSPAALYGAPGPRRHRLPAAVSPGRAAAWLIAAAAVAVLGRHLHSGRPQLAAVCAAIAAAAALIGAASALLELWARRDPLRLNAAEAAAAAGAVRSIQWNPLAGQGPLSAAGAYMLEGWETCTQLQSHPAWNLPGAQPLRWQVDLDEETFQIARAAAALDRAAAAGQREALSAQSARQLDDALFDRLVALHRCLHTLTDLATAAASQPGRDDQVVGAALAAAVENELRTGQWYTLTADLAAHIDGYAALGAAHSSPR